MPEGGADKEPRAGAVGGAAHDEVSEAAPDTEGATPAKPRFRWLFYGLGLSLQTLLWFLLFLGIAVAVLVGGKLTEFRYVGF